MAIDLSALFGQQPDYSQFISPAETQRMQSGANQSALLNAAIALLGSSGQTRQPISTGQALGGALGAGLEGYQQSFDRNLKQIVTGMQLSELKKKQDAQKRYQELVKGATTQIPQPIPMATGQGSQLEILSRPEFGGGMATEETVAALRANLPTKEGIDLAKLQPAVMQYLAETSPEKFIEAQASLAKAGQKTYKQVDLGNAIAFMDDNLNIVKQIPKQKEGKEVDTFGRENTLRSQYLDNTKKYTSIAQAYSKIETAAKDPSAAGDLSLIFGYMKILDSESAVRETEFANAQNAAGVPDQIRNLYNRLKSGERLNENQRADFVNKAKTLVASQKDQLENLNKQYTNIATSYQLDPTKIVIDPFKTLDLTLKDTDKKPKPSAREQLGIPQLPSGVIVRQR
jgi:hypothetical protein